jgi:ferrous iron transport protein A
MLNSFEIKPGDRLQLIDFGATPTLVRQKLLSYGLRLGVEVVVVRAAPLNCPLQFSILGRELAMRRVDLKYLVWELL